MFRHKAGARGGFTLIELAIVLGVIGVLTVGLWRLLATSNQQTKDSLTAQQQIALINAAKGWLADAGGGQVWFTTGNAGAPLLTNTAYNLPLPSSNTSVAVCQAAYTAAGTPLLTGLCNYLPSGFYNSTTNPYLQSYRIQVLTGSSSAAQNYSFMIIASGGSRPPADTDGARIANLLGGDGGFVYKSNVCGAPTATLVCGAMGAWVSNTATNYGYTPAATGSVVSRSFVTALADNSNFWLARNFMPGDSATDPLYNTMKTNLYLNDSTNTNSFFVGNGSIQGSGSAIPGTPQIEMTQPAANQNNLITLSTGCSFVGTPCTGNNYAVSVTTGDIGVGGAITATKIYSSSDLRLKTDIKPIPDPLGALMKVDAVSFTFKNSGSKGMGVIAQDLEKVYPQLVLDNGKSKFVEYNGLIGPLIGAVQQLKNENDELRAQIKAQNEREDRLEQRLKLKAQP